MGYENYRFLEGDYENLSGAFYVRDSVLFSEVYNDFVKNKDSGKPYYEIPLRALIVKDVDNLLVAGRNLGAEFVAQSSIRVIPTCRAMGEAAGIAAGLSILACCPFREVDTEALRAEIRAHGGITDIAQIS